MKSLMVMAVVGLVVAVVSAREHGDRDHDEDRSRSCICKNQCNGNTVTKNLACRSKTQYLHCAAAACTSVTCAADQLFNETAGACQACPTGQQVDANGQRCVCKPGTHLDRKTGLCVDCPKGFTQVAQGECRCPSPTVVNKGTNTCQVCPPLTTNTEESCTCTDPKMFFNSATFTCMVCPGNWVSVTETGRHGRTTVHQVCQCPAANDVFDKRTVKCVTCPTGSGVVSDDEGNKRCSCSGAMRYDGTTNTCVAESNVKGDRRGGSRDD